MVLSVGLPYVPISNELDKPSEYIQAPMPSEENIHVPAPPEQYLHVPIHPETGRGVESEESEQDEKSVAWSSYYPRFTGQPVTVKGEGFCSEPGFRRMQVAFIYDDSCWE